MDYHAFFQDVTKWMDISNRKIKELTLFNPEYWNWVIESVRVICDKYDNHPLVQKQMKLLYEYQEETYRECKEDKSHGAK